MAEVASRSLEQLCRRGVVQVDVFRIRKDELHQPERVLRAGALAQPQLALTEQGQGLRAGRHHLCVVAVAAHDLQVVALEPGRVAHQGGQQLVAHDRARHVPVGAEDHGAHRLGHHRRAGVQRPSDDDGHVDRRPLRIGSVPGPQPEQGDVDADDRAGAEFGQPAQALEREFYLLHAQRHRHVQRLQRFAAEHAVGVQAVAPLEATDPLGECGLVARRGLRRLGRQVADGNEAPLQRGCIAERVTRFDRGRGANEAR